jgi:hypothetical protein
VKHLGPVVGQLGRLARVELRDDSRVRDYPRVGREQPRHVLPERNPRRAEAAGEERRGQVRAPAAQRGDLAVRRGADEPGNHRDDAPRKQRRQHPLDRAVGPGEVRRRLAEGRVGMDDLRGVHVSRVAALCLQHRLHQPRAHPLAPRHQVVHGARRKLAQQPEALGQRLQLFEDVADVGEHVGPQPAGRQQRAGHLGVTGAELRDEGRDGARVAAPGLVGHAEQRVRGARHRGDHHDGGLLAMPADDLDRVANGSGIGQRCAAELVHVGRSAGTGHG